jgi:nitric oxide reductase activation protein
MSHSVTSVGCRPRQGGPRRYLRQMCAPEQYLVIETVGDLPRELPKIYQRLVRAG